MKKTLLLGFCLALSGGSFAQTDAASPLLGGNIIKLNISSAAIEHYMLQYERVLGLNRSIGMSIGYSSGVELPFKSTLLDEFGGNEDARRAIETTEFDKVTITPEYRFYLSAKGAPIGFYWATFARYTNLSFTQLYTFTPANRPENTAVVDGKLSGVGAGAMIGMQWALGSSLTLDWWILGPFAGVQSGSFEGTFTDPLTPEDKVDLEKDIESVEIPLWEIDASFEGNKVIADIKGPFYGLRMFGISLGFRF